MEYFILYEVLNDRRHYHLLMLTKHFFVIVWQLPVVLETDDHGKAIGDEAEHSGGTWSQHR